MRGCLRVSSMNGQAFLYEIFFQSTGLAQPANVMSAFRSADATVIKMKVAQSARPITRL